MGEKPYRFEHNTIKQAVKSSLLKNEAKNQIALECARPLISWPNDHLIEALRSISPVQNHRLRATRQYENDRKEVHLFQETAGHLCLEEAAFVGDPEIDDGADEPRNSQTTRVYNIRNDSQGLTEGQKFTKRKLEEKLKLSKKMRK